MGVRMFSCFARLRRAQRWPRMRIQQSQLAILRDQVEHATARIPYYRERLPDPVLRLRYESLEELCNLPFLTKQEVKACFPDQFVADGLRWEHLYSISTSGTYDRVMVFQDERKRNWDRAADLLLEIQGNSYRPGQRT